MWVEDDTIRWGGMGWDGMGGDGNGMKMAVAAAAAGVEGVLGGKSCSFPS